MLLVILNPYTRAILLAIEVVIRNNTNQDECVIVAICFGSIRVGDFKYCGVSTACEHFLLGVIQKEVHTILLSDTIENNVTTMASTRCALCEHYKS